MPNDKANADAIDILVFPDKIIANITPNSHYVQEYYKVHLQKQA